MIDYYYDVHDCEYTPAHTTGRFRQVNHPARLKVRLVAPGRFADRAAVLHLDGEDADQWKDLRRGDPVRVYGRPDNCRAAEHDDGFTWQPLEMHRMKRGHSGFEPIQVPRKKKHLAH